MRIGTKKIITILAVLLLAISVTGCTSDDNGSDNGASSSSSSAASPTGDEYTNSIGMGIPAH